MITQDCHALMAVAVLLAQEPCDSRLHGCASSPDWMRPSFAAPEATVATVAARTVPACPIWPDRLVVTVRERSAD